MGESTNNFPSICRAMDSNITMIIPQNVYLQNLFLGVLNAILAVPTAVANLWIIIAILTTPELRTPSYYLLTNLAFSDLAMGMFCQTGYSLTAFSYISRNIQTFCISHLLSGYLSGMVTIASGLTITAISVDRYLAISLKLRYRATVTPRRIRGLLVALWIVVFFLMSLSLYAPVNAISLSGSIAFTICVFILIFCYTKSFRELRIYCNQIQPQGSHQENFAATPSNAIDVLKYKKLLNTMVLILVLVVICYLPLLGIFITFVRTNHPNTVLVIAMLSLVGLNSTLNPIVYVVRMRDIRQACIRILKKLPIICKP